jgi:pimeloyl-ACP methyl ester carboxylesterase
VVWHGTHSIALPYEFREGPMTFSKQLLLAAILALAPSIANSVAALWATLPDPPAMPAADESGFVIHDGARLYYAIFHRGAGRPVIMLHGGMASSDSWGFEVPKLAGHEVIVMDSRAQGRSSGSTAPLTYQEMTSDVVALMDKLRLRRASVVGASDGAIIGLMLAIEYPQRIDRLFAWGANFNTHAERRSLPDPSLKAVGKAYLANAAENYRRLSPTPDGFPQLLAALGHMYATEPNLTPAELGRIRVPTVIADGAYEQFIEPSHTRLLARLIPGAKLLIFPDVSHGGPLQNPAAFHNAVTELLNRTGAGMGH